MLFDLFDDRTSVTRFGKNSIGRKEAAFFQKRALPLSLLAASALSDLDVLKTSELIVHCFLDGNIAPFSDPHDWSTLAIHFWVFCLLYLMGFQVIWPTKNCNLMDFTGI